MTPRRIALCPVRAPASRPVALLLPLVLTGLFLLHSARASADDEGAFEARVLFQQGVELADQNQWSEAAERFAQALALRDSPVIAYNLGSALQKLRRWVEACALFARVRDATGAAEPLRRSAATAHAELSPRLGRLTLRVQGHQPEDVILLDSRPLQADQLGVAIPTDPGAHHLAVRRGERTLHQETVLVFEGATRELTLRLSPDPEHTARLAPSAVLPPATVPLNKPAPPSDAEASGSPWWIWAGAGALVAGAITAGAILLINADDGPSPAASDQVLHLPRTVHGSP